MTEITNESINKEQPFSMKKIIAPLLAVVVGMIMVILDSTAMNIALPGLVSGFDSSLSVLQWTITGYTLALSAVIPLAGWMTDRFGAKRIFLISLVLFTLGSLLCSFATSPVQLIVFRIIQGIGGGMIAPIGMAMIFRLAPPDRIGSVMAVLGVPMMLAPALGPILAGWLIEVATWHWIFLINIPVGIVGILIGLKYLPKVARKTVPSLDILGMILAPIAFATIAYAVNEGGKSWSSPQTITALIIGGIALLLFIIVELRHPQPLLDLRVFSSSAFNKGIVISWLMQIAMFGSFVLVPYYLQEVRGYDSLETGLILLPQAVSSGLFMPIGGKMFDKFGARPLVIIGLSFIITGLYLLSQISVDSSIGFLMIPLALMGAGMGLSMMAVNTHILQAAPFKLVTRVTALTTAAQQVMVSFAVAGLTGYLVSRTLHHAEEVSEVPANPMVAAFGDTFLVAAGIAFAGLLLGLFLSRPKKRPEEAEADRAEQASVNMMH